MVIKFINSKNSAAGKPNFSDRFKKDQQPLLKKVVYNMDIMKQSACLVVNPIKEFSYGFLGESDLRLIDGFDEKL